MHTYRQTDRPDGLTYIWYMEKPNEQEKVKTSMHITELKHAAEGKAGNIRGRMSTRDHGDRSWVIGW